MGSLGEGTMDLGSGPGYCAFGKAVVGGATEGGAGKGGKVESKNPTTLVTTPPKRLSLPAVSVGCRIPAKTIFNLAKLFLVNFSPSRS